MQLIGISDCISDICDRQGCDLKKFCSFGHAIADQEFLGRTSDGVVEDLTEVTSVQAAAGCDILNGNIILEILFNKRERLLDIKITDTSILFHADSFSRAHKVIQKKPGMSDKMKG